MKLNEISMDAASEEDARDAFGEEAAHWLRLYHAYKQEEEHLKYKFLRFEAKMGLEPLNFNVQSQAGMVVSYQVIDDGFNTYSPSDFNKQFVEFQNVCFRKTDLNPELIHAIERFEQRSRKVLKQKWYAQSKYVLAKEAK